MTKQQFIDELFVECEDALVEGDVDTIMEYFEDHYTDLTASDFESVFVKTISNIMDKSELEGHKQKFGYFLYLYLADLFGIQDIYIPPTFEEMGDSKFGAYGWKRTLELGENPFKFKKVTVEFGKVAVAVPSYIQCDELIITGNSVSDSIVRIKCTATTITFNTYVEDVQILMCNNIIFDEKAVKYKFKDNVSIPVLTDQASFDVPDRIEKVVLPPVDGVQVPRWMCTKLKGDKVTIYKEVGQKIRIFSAYREWLTEHVKSI